MNGVAPGPIWTSLNPRGGAPAKKVETFGEGTPMKRPGEPNEVAPAFLFLGVRRQQLYVGPGVASQRRYDR